MKTRLIPVLLLMLIVVPQAQAGWVNRTMGECARVLKTKYLAVMRNHEGRTLDVHYKTAKYKKAVIGNPDLVGQEIQIELQKQLGAGYFGSVYDVLNIKGLKNLVLGALPIIAKLPHSLNIPRFRFPLWFTESRSIREYLNYEFLKKHLPEIEANLAKDQGWDPAWEKGNLPESPIVGVLPTKELGTVLLKVKIKGKTLSDIQKIREENGNELSADMIKGLRDIYTFVQAVYSEAPAFKRSIFATNNDHYSPDIRPENLVWVDDPIELARLHYKRPGFALYELDQVPKNQPQYIEGTTSFEDYKDEFIRYLDGTKSS